MPRIFYLTIVYLVLLVSVSGAAIAADSAARFVVSPDNATVEDKDTGLIWQRTVTSEGFTWKDAFDYCTSLKLAQQQDWQLPTLKELQSLVVEPTPPSKVYIDAIAFPNTPGAFFWTRSANPGQIAAVFFDMSKYPTGLGPKGNLGHIRCVRGTLNPSYEAPKTASYNLMTIPRSEGQ